VIFANLLNSGNYSYSIIVQDSNGCLGADTIHIIVNTGIGQKSNDDIISVYPNPSNGNINCLINGISGDINIEVLSMNGKILHSQETKLTMPHSIINIDLSHLPKGSYILVLKNSIIIQ